MKILKIRIHLNIEKKPEKLNDKQKTEWVIIIIISRDKHQTLNCVDHDLREC